MGTRNLTAVYVDGECKVAQYGQWDGYPSGVGADVVEALKEIMAEGGLANFADKVRACNPIDSDEVSRRYAELGIEGEWITMDEARRFKERYPQLDRDMGGAIIRYIYENGPQDLFLDLGFTANPLCCEWAYIIDLDEEVLEVYSGYIRDSSPDNRFATGDGVEVVGLLDSRSFDEVAGMSVGQLVGEWENLEEELYAE